VLIVTTTNSCTSGLVRSPEESLAQKGYCPNHHYLSYQDSDSLVFYGNFVNAHFGSEVSLYIDDQDDVANGMDSAVFPKEDLAIA
jgi:hypothetical protein